MALKEDIVNHFPAPAVTPESGRDDMTQAGHNMVKINRLMDHLEQLAGALPQGTALNTALGGIRSGLQDALAQNHTIIKELGGRVVTDEFVERFVAELEGGSSP